MSRRSILPPAVAACRGLSPTEREALIASAKDRALRFTWAVKARSAAGVHEATRGMSEDEWRALAVVLAEAVQPGSMRLALVARTVDGAPARGDVA